MGYTHFDKPCGVNGIYTGAKGSEVRQDNKNFVVNFAFNVLSAAQTVCAVMPFAGTLTETYAAATNSAQSSSTTVVLGSAGTTLATVAWTSPGTMTLAQSSAVTVANSTGTAGIIVSAIRAATGTTGESTVTCVFTRAS